MNGSESGNDLGEFVTLLKQRCSVRNKPMMYILYFAVVIGIFGLIGCAFSLGNWIVLGWGNDNVNAVAFFQNLSTYAIAIAATALVDYMISEKNNKGDGASSGRNQFLLLLFGGFVFVVFLTVWTYFPISQFYAAAWVLIGTFLAWIIWWIANADNLKLLEKLPPSDAGLGGDTKKVSRDSNTLIELGLN